MLKLHVAIFVHFVILNAVYDCVVQSNPTNLAIKLDAKKLPTLNLTFSLLGLKPRQSDIDLCFMRTDELIGYYGFIAEEYDVETEDGYILKMFRCYSTKFAEEDRSPILLIPGMYDTSDTFCLSPPDESLAYFLAERKYDVFLYNPRGNKYSHGHRDNKRFDSSKKYGLYWAFSWFEMGYYDLPAVIEEILRITKREKVSAIGHSEGGTSLFVLLSTRPEFNSIVKLAVSMASFTFMTNIGFPLDVILLAVQLFKNFRDFEFAPNTLPQKILSLLICTIMNGAICDHGINFVLGPSYNERSNTAVSVCHYPAAGSFNQILHYSQGYVHKTFGPMMKIGQTTTRNFDLGKITAPNAFLYSNYPDKNHIDFIWSKTAYATVYPKIIELDALYT
ncbi:lipase 1-like isoform X2 [Sitodiplosis mosellana]|uniref:lipase 1-like isoform X2 n=1 Tax=Sitodiplosis mosellana TaxID=263140 RepID=UPI002443992C|nr:lipase 1-like isoform X2 [Sitodiplosis mosellana]